MAIRVGLTYRFEAKAGPYLRALREAGLDPVSITPDCRRGLDGLAGLVLSGGTDLDPGLYGQTRHPNTQQPDRERDELERELVLQALHGDLPVLAICRGMQLFNIVHGGTLHQDVDGHSAKELGAHHVQVMPGTMLATITGGGPKEVNSRHHQTVDRLGNGLIVSAQATADGTIEAIERPDRRFALAVQWHPEDRIDSDELDRRLFLAYAAAVGG
jgi:putative glutamine amidotransferase